MSRNLRLEVGDVRLDVKGEMGDKFPRNVGLKHDEPNARNVLHFYNRMLRCTRSDLDKKCYMCRLVLDLGAAGKVLVPARSLVQRRSWMHGLRVLQSMQLR